MKISEISIDKIMDTANVAQIHKWNTKLQLEISANKDVIFPSLKFLDSLTLLTEAHTLQFMNTGYIFSKRILMWKISRDSAFTIRV